MNGPSLALQRASDVERPSFGYRTPYVDDTEIDAALNEAELTEEPEEVISHDLEDEERLRAAAIYFDLAPQDATLKKAKEVADLISLKASLGNNFEPSTIESYFRQISIDEAQLRQYSVYLRYFLTGSKYFPVATCQLWTEKRLETASPKAREWILALSDAKQARHRATESGEIRYIGSSIYSSFSRFQQDQWSGRSLKASLFAFATHVLTSVHGLQQVNQRAIDLAKADGIELEPLRSPLQCQFSLLGDCKSLNFLELLYIAGSRSRPTPLHHLMVLFRVLIRTCKLCP